MNKSKIDSRKYVVLDVETNGLASLKHDLLSISIFRPDNCDEYERFLPLELNNEVLTSEINGITLDNLKGQSPLTQQEVDDLITRFELSSRTILTYGHIDAKFIKNYFKRHKLKGFDSFHFFNYKHNIISSRFSEGNITKDNLCTLFGIKGVQSIHSGINDCRLEWELFKAMDGDRLLITNNDVFRFNDEYVVPASYIANYSNFKYCLPSLPKLDYEKIEIAYFIIDEHFIKKYPTNFNGMIVEHEINSLINAEKIDSLPFLLKNKSKCQYIGTLPSSIHTVEAVFNPDGSFTAVKAEDSQLVNDINKSSELLRSNLRPLVDFIKEKIFNNNKIYSQELKIDATGKVLAKCDLSSEDSVLEIKATRFSPEHAYQLYYEAQGRRSFILEVFFHDVLYVGERCISPARITAVLSEVVFGNEEERECFIEKHNIRDCLKPNTNELIRRQLRLLNPSFHVGDKVKHTRFGMGMVRAVDGNILTVDFESVGIKRLAKDLAPIAKINE